MKNPFQRVGLACYRLQRARRSVEQSQGLLTSSVSKPTQALQLLGLLLMLAWLLPALPGHAQGRPKQYQIPTTFDSVYTKRPARMAFFIAWEYYGGGQIEWVTLREGKIAAFAVQYSPDGHTWQEVGKMEPKPGSRETRSYTFYDANLRRYGVPVLYYRVQEIAKSGRSTYSPVRSIRLSSLDATWRTPASPAKAQGLLAPDKL